MHSLQVFFKILPMTPFFTFVRFRAYRPSANDPPETYDSGFECRQQRITLTHTFEDYLLPHFRMTHYSDRWSEPFADRADLWRG
jgi:hypothetical protein